MSNPTRISPQEASAKLAEGWTYVDVRTEQEFEAGHPPGAVNVPIALMAGGGVEEGGRGRKIGRAEAIEVQRVRSAHASAARKGSDEDLS